MSSTGTLYSKFVVPGQNEVQRDAHSRKGPTIIALVDVGQQSLLSKALIELVEVDLHVCWSVDVVLVVEPLRPVVVEPLQVHRINRVFRGLEPVAGQFGKHDLANPFFQVKVSQIGFTGAGSGPR